AANQYADSFVGIKGLYDGRECGRSALHQINGHDGGCLNGVLVCRPHLLGCEDAFHWRAHETYRFVSERYGIVYKMSNSGCPPYGLIGIRYIYPVKASQLL